MRRNLIFLALGVAVIGFLVYVASLPRPCHKGIPIIKVTYNS